MPGSDSASLRGSPIPLTEAYDVALLDLDGVVYIGQQAVPGAPEALGQARAAGMRLAFVTNNAARTPQVVADHLSELGVPATADEVITSSQAAAHYLADRLPAGSAVLVVGTTGLTEALRERGLRPVTSADDEPAAVVQGYSPGLDWRQLAEGAVAIRRGVPWVATNLDPTVPSPRGPLPGNGSLVAALRHATGVQPVATGKPDPTMHRESVQRSGAQRPLVVGDRLDTDIEGANAVGCPGLLVLTGVTSPGDLIAAVPEHRPDYVARDLSGLLRPHPAVRVGPDGSAHCGQWNVQVDRAGADQPALVLRHDGGDVGSRDGGGEGSGEGGGEPTDDLDPLRALCVSAWRQVDSGAPAPDRWPTRGTDDASRDVLADLELSSESA